MARDNAAALSAIDPDRNAVVHAAAGTGKTWLLVSRLIRLLLEGTSPSSILAITFTRKAAAEMRLRLGQRLLAMCEASEGQLHAMLREIGVTPISDSARRARELYETLLVTPHEIRATTFHAFCQELLTRFAFEAGIAPAFEILEQTTELETAAWRALDRDLAEDSELANIMERLLRAAGGLDNTRESLWQFLNHRSDWWAYTEGQPDPVGYASLRLQEALQVLPGHDPLSEFSNDANVRGLVQRLIDGLSRNTPASLSATVENLQSAANSEESAQFHRHVCQALLTKEGEPRAFRVPKALAESLGGATVDALTRDREALLDRLRVATEHQKRRTTWQSSCDWYVVGSRLLQHFQELKRAQGALDFSDLEWLTYQLLSRSRHAEWVQYKLDQRIDHLLVDEFQDTNPTQWRLLLPLLDEMAAGSAERPRSVFLVGDEKQSIYRFRRADPALFTLARDWLTERSAAHVHEQHVSWRSSPAVVRFVNLLFDKLPEPAPAARPLDHTLQNFRAHDTHRRDLWGHAEVLPLITRDPNSESTPDFRNPLEQPRIVDEDQRRRREGDLVAATIKSLLGRPVRRGDEVRALRYGDVMILLRTRTHAAMYEAALRHAGIPYTGAGRGTFLDCLEVRDMLDLLRLLVSPFEDVALAAVLRSPMFAASDADLLALANIETETSWYARLVSNYRDKRDMSPLARAARLLHEWRQLADRIPVHDLLDRIYFDADVPERYRSAAPAHLHQRVAANLTRLLDLALEADGGRFPSLARFLSRLEILTEEDNESLGADAVGDQVRILTVHAAKGLESPVVFVVDAARDTSAPERGAEALIEWPIDQARPSAFLLVTRRSEADSSTRALLDRQAGATFQEESNLLYVALTRAQQWLYVSGCDTGRRKGNALGAAGESGRGWYGYIERRLEAARANSEAQQLGLALRPITVGPDEQIVNLCGSITYGTPPALPPAAPTQAIMPFVDAALTRPFGERTPALVTSDDEAEDAPSTDIDQVRLLSNAKQRGVLIHRMLELLTGETTREIAEQKVQQEFGADIDNTVLQECWREARAVIDAPELARFFDRHHYQEARNEVVVLYRANQRDVTGVIDRLLITENRLILIDYKTHRMEADATPALVSRYLGQLRLYAEGLRRLWPNRRVEAVLLFTASRRSAGVDLD